MATRKTSNSAASADGTVTSTRRKVQAAYQDAAEKLVAAEEVKARPEQEAALRRQQETVQTAVALMEDAKGVQEITALKTTLGRMLGQLAEQLDGELQKFQTVQKAVTLKEQELKEFYEIEKNVQTLAALVEAQAQERTAFEAETTREREEVETEMAEARERWQKEKSDYDLAVKAQKEVDKKARDREREEYEYAFSREKALARNQFLDEKATQEKELALAREAAGKELAEREGKVTERELEYKELRATVEKLAKERDLAVKQAVDALREKLTGEHKAQLELLQKTFEGERGVLVTKLQASESAVKEQAAQLAKANAQLEAAYGKVQDIAVKALEGSANAKTIQGLQSLLSESVRSGKNPAEK